MCTVVAQLLEWQRKRTFSDSLSCNSGKSRLVGTAQGLDQLPEVAYAIILAVQRIVLDRDKILKPMTAVDVADRSLPAIGCFC